MVKRLLVFLCVFSFSFSESYSSSKSFTEIEQDRFCDEGFLAGTLIKTADDYQLIEKLSVGDLILSVDSEGQIVKSKIAKIQKTKAKSFVLINLDTQILLAAVGQKFYLPESKAWEKAKDLSLASQLLAGNERLAAKSLQLVEHPTEVFAISLDENHNFFATKSDVLVHNVLPFSIGIYCAFGGGSAKLLGVSVGAGIGAFCAKLLMTRRREESPRDFILDNPISQRGPDKYITPIPMVKDSILPQFPSSSPSVQVLVTPSEGLIQDSSVLFSERKTEAVGNIKEYFNSHPVGKEHKDNFDKHPEKHGAWQAKERIKLDNGTIINKGDYIKLDIVHRNHFEFFDRRDERKGVLNLDLSKNEEKSKRAGGKNNKKS